MDATIKNLNWHSDYNGYEVGFPEYDVIGLYENVELGYLFYIEMENSMVVQIFPSEEVEE